MAGASRLRSISIDGPLAGSGNPSTIVVDLAGGAGASCENVHVRNFISNQGVAGTTRAFNVGLDCSLNRCSAQLVNRGYNLLGTNGSITSTTLEGCNAQLCGDGYVFAGTNTGVFLRSCQAVQCNFNGFGNTAANGGPLGTVLNRVHMVNCSSEGNVRDGFHFETVSSSAYIMISDCQSIANGVNIARFNYFGSGGTSVRNIVSASLSILGTGANHVSFAGGWTSTAVLSA